MDPVRATDALLALVQADGRIWCGPTTWAGETAMRISVSSWRTTLEDGALAADVLLELAGTVRQASRRALKGWVPPWKG